MFERNLIGKAGQVRKVGRVAKQQQHPEKEKARFSQAQLPADILV
jgi:hypothetical protein